MIHLGLHEAPRSIHFLVSIGTSSIFSVDDCLWDIFKLHSLGYNRFSIQNVPFVSIKFNGDVLLKLPHVENLKSHSSEMQRMDKNYDGHCRNPSLGLATKAKACKIASQEEARE
jgi:hypothetical protein